MEEWGRKGWCCLRGGAPFRIRKAEARGAATPPQSIQAMATGDIKIHFSSEGPPDASIPLSGPDPTRPRSVTILTFQALLKSNISE
jgi:hypothetical protein